MQFLKNLLKKNKKGINSSTNISKGGSQIFQHEQSFSRDKLEVYDGLKNLNTREEYYTKMFGKIDKVYHEIIPLNPHIDVYSFAPNKDRSYRLLVSGGMSDKRMNAPEQLKEFSRAEIVFPVKESTYQLEKSRIANLVRVYAGFPHQYSTFLFHGHTIESYNKGESLFPEFDLLFKDILFVMAIAFDNLAENTFRDLVIDGDKVTFLLAIPLMESEYKYKMEKSTGDLIDKFGDKFPIVFDHLRNNLV